MPQTNPQLLTRAKAMRAEMTPAEQKLWLAIRAKRFAEVKFSRQVVIGSYIADFAARSHRLVIEVGGHTHIDPTADERRSDILRSHGYHVIRFTNRDVMTNLEGVLEAIHATLAAAPLPNPLPKGERA